MFCGKCGSENPDDALFCTSCGAPLAKEAPARPAPAAGVAPARPITAASGSNKHKLIGICAVAVVALLAVILIISIFSGRSANKAAEEIVRAVLEGDSGDLVDVMPKAYLKAIARQTDRSVGKVEDDFEDDFDLVISRFDDAFSRIKVNATTSTDYTGAALDAVKALYKASDIKVKAGKLVSVSFQVTLNGEKKSGRMDIPVVKIGGSWYMDVMNIGNTNMPTINGLLGS